MPSLNTRASDGPATGRQYWRSLEDLADTDQFREFVEKEFPNFAPELLEGPTRRRFLSVMGASLALAGMTGCRWPKETILPHSKRPANRVPGVPVEYATAMELGGIAQGLLVSSFDGRPIKVDGNDLHPVSRGKSDAFAQASVLELYNPDRVRSVQFEGTEPGRGVFVTESMARLDAALAGLRTTHAADRGAGLAILSEATSSPVIAELRAALQAALPQSTWYEYEPVSRDNERRGTELAFGAPQRPIIDLRKADVIVSLDDDFLMWHPDHLRLTREFANRRRPDAGNNFDINRLYVFESALTVTGARADHRAGVTPAAVADVARQLAAGLAGESVETVGTIDLARLVADLQSHRGRAVILAGPSQPAEVHAAVAQLNAQIGAIGSTVRYVAAPDAQRPTHAEAIATLATRMQTGEIQSLVILGGNPVFDAPADLNFADGLAKVARRFHLTQYANETSLRCGWIIPRAHYLESWDLVRAFDGTLSITQPLIEPLFGGRTSAEVIATILNDGPASAHALTRKTFDGLIADADKRSAWKLALHDGVLAGSAWPVETPTPRFDLGSLVAPAGTSGLTLVFVPDYGVYDGRFTNNGWLQENPDPLTKLTWDNAAIFSPADARALGVERHDWVRTAVGGNELTVQVFVQPGVPRGVVMLPLGYGNALGVVSTGTGFNAYAVRTSAGLWSVPGVTIERHRAPSGQGGRILATTQDHHYMESSIGRAEIEKRVDRLVRETDVAHYKEHTDFAKHIVHLPMIAPLFEQAEYIGDNQWAMAIDLSGCIGCGACQVACTAENNIPVVGKEEIHMGREMHWIRVDRYFTGDPDDAESFAFQPVTCHHCENAPCEQVCPVGATVHDEEGLNAMTYNRCIGTRYCANNCPYKVRRFNWFWNHHGPKHPRAGVELDNLEKMNMNPKVSVRSRGVMEKCTFCTQRINDVRIKAKNEGRPIRDGEIQPACAQACPADAIVFGDKNDPNSRVKQLLDHNRRYYMLEELNVRPRLGYLARITNPNDAAGHGGNGHAATGRDTDDHGAAASTTEGHS